MKFNYQVRIIMMTIVLVSAGMLLIWQVTTKQVIDNKCGDVGKNAKIENEYLCIKNDSREKVDNSHTLPTHNES